MRLINGHKSEYIHMETYIDRFGQIQVKKDNKGFVNITRYKNG